MDKVSELEKTMSPPPANLKSLKEKTQTAFSINNTLRTGIPNTAMLSFESVLTTKELWDVSFYVMSLPHKVPPNQISSRFRSFNKDLANLTDYELKKVIKRSPNINTNKNKQSVFKKEPLNLDNKKQTPLLGIREAQKDFLSSKNLPNLENLTIKSTLIDAYLEGFEYAETSLAIKNKALFKN